MPCFRVFEGLFCSLFARDTGSFELEIIIEGTGNCLLILYLAILGHLFSFTYRRKLGHFANGNRKKARKQSFNDVEIRVNTAPFFLGGFHQKIGHRGRFPVVGLHYPRSLWPFHGYP